MIFFEECRLVAVEWWDGSFVYLFVMGIGDGSLLIDCFSYYVLQDFYYLMYFVKVQVFGVVYVKDLFMMGRMVGYVQGIYEVEMVLYCEFMEFLGIIEEECVVFKLVLMVYFYMFYMYRLVMSG